LAVLALLLSIFTKVAVSKELFGGRKFSLSQNSADCSDINNMSIKTSFLKLQLWLRVIGIIGFAAGRKVHLTANAPMAARVQQNFCCEPKEYILNSGLLYTGDLRTQLMHPSDNTPLRPLDLYSGTGDFGVALYESDMSGVLARLKSNLKLNYCL
jgi:hypothetical protein